MSVLKRLWRASVLALWTVREILRTGWGLMREPLIFAVQLVAALIVIFEEWGWRPLSDALARLARYAPIARLEHFIAGLGPYPSLFVFVTPTAFLAPLKLLAVYLLASGSYWTATGLFVGAKIAATALVARLFTLTKPSLMRIDWFARAYNWFVPWEQYFSTLIRRSWPWRYGRMVKNRIRQWVSRWWVATRRIVANTIAQNKPMKRLIARLPERWRPEFDKLPLGTKAEHQSNTGPSPSGKTPL